MAGRRRTGPGQALGWLPAVAALACPVLAGCLALHSVYVVLQGANNVAVLGNK